MNSDIIVVIAATVLGSIGLAAGLSPCETIAPLLDYAATPEAAKAFGWYINEGNPWESWKALNARHKEALNNCIERQSVPECPQEFHFSWTGHGPDLLIDFVTQADVTSEVQFKRTTDETWNDAPSHRQRYKVPIRWYNPTGLGPWTHTAYLNDLHFNSDYEVHIHTQGCSNTTVLTVRTMRSVNKPNDPLDIAIVGDMGVVPLGFLVVEQMLKDFNAAQWPDAFILAGDISYAGIDVNIPFLNITGGDEFEPIWDWFNDMMVPVCGRIPCMFTVGNHDVFYNASAFISRYHMPGALSNGNGNFWYSYNAGPVHFISLSTENPYSIGSPQWLWALNDLKKAEANRTAAPWVVVVAHRPFYSSSFDEESQHTPGSPLLTAFEGIFSAFHVDVVINGHIHMYERTHPVHKGEVAEYPTKGPDGIATYLKPSAPLYVMVGSGGGAPEVDEWIEPQPKWSAYRVELALESYGYGRLQVRNSTHLDFHFASVNSTKTLDAFRIIKPSQ